MRSLSLYFNLSYRSMWLPSTSYIIHTTSFTAMFIGNFFACLLHFASFFFFSSKFTNQLCSCGTGESVGLIASINSVRCSRGTSQTSTINGASSLCADDKQADTQGKGNGTGRKKRAGAAGWFAMAPIDLGLHTRWTARPGQVSLIILRIREVSRPDRDDMCRWQIGKSASRAVF